MHCYLNPTTLYEEAEVRLRELLNTRKKLQKRLAGYSPGKIHIVRNKRWLQFYLRTDPKDKSGRYLSRADEGTIRRYLQKKYDGDALARVNSEIQSLEQFLATSQDSVTNLRNLYSEQSLKIQKHIIPIDLSDEEYVAEWLDQPYEGKAIDPERVIYITDRGESVRSKSELTIANALQRAGVPYKYECPFVLANGAVIYPDFTVLNVRKRQEILWEHRGMMDDREYAKAAVLRVKQLVQSGVVLGETLVITEETNTCPLGTEEIEWVIKSYF